MPLGWRRRPGGPGYACHSIVARVDKKAQSFNDLYAFDPGEDESKWSLVHTTNAPPPRARHVSFALDDNTMLIFGGVDKRNRFGDLWVYNCPTKTWQQVKADGCNHTDENGDNSIIWPGARAHFTATKFADRIFIYGGYGGAGVVYGDLWVLHITLREGDVAPQLKCACQISR
jgi:dynein heavy chain, axonemal